MEGVNPQVLFYIFGLPIRDTVVSTWVMMAVLVLLAIIIGKRQPVALELLVDFLHDLISSVIGRPAGPFLPFLGALAIFIAVANTIGVVPFLTTPTSDINTPLALALTVFISVHYFGVREKGVSRYFKDMLTPIFVLPLEIIGQLTRTLSLTMRLFGNVVSIELIIVIIFALAPLFVSLPLVGFGIFTGMLQAYIFTLLAAVYIGAGLEASEPVSQTKSEDDRKE
jgi:F-type H+-transporting ATPase subunit a